jgi:hypothetical protein
VRAGRTELENLIGKKPFAAVKLKKKHIAAKGKKHCARECTKNIAREEKQLCVGNIALLVKYCAQ